MHPYRTLWQASPPGNAEAEPGLRLAIWVMTVAGFIETASALPRGAPASPQTLFGAVCVVAGLLWLMRPLRRQPEGVLTGGSRRR